MKILLISDSHGCKKKLLDLLEKEKHDLVFFMGDGLNDISSLGISKARKVCGNCDFFSNEAIIRYENIYNLKIMITHGHVFKTKHTFSLLTEQAKNDLCDIVCCGHTHKQIAGYINGVFVVNPGAFKNNEYAILNVKENILIKQVLN